MDSCTKRESIVHMARYGPPNINFNPDSNDDGSNASKPSNDGYRSNVKSQITRILHKVMDAKAIEELPSFMTQNVDTLLAAMAMPDLIEEIIKEDRGYPGQH
ncbi:hypothetical protein HJC23_006229 [Cyclotella cryptica]|uniref:Uncharacterized protein n=1 Tax=Cyclotella cryptica TaxID=29204 RepID=A0ABD3PWY7_9STRA